MVLIKLMLGFFPPVQNVLSGIEGRKDRQTGSRGLRKEREREFENTVTE
jgi:hypothetical protein